MTLPTPHPLNSCVERINRTGEHLADLRLLITKTTRDHEKAIGVQFNPQPPYSSSPILPPAFPTPYRLGVLIGEICYNLRSSLDYLVYELARHDSGSIQHGTQFPIEDTQKGFGGRANSYLRGVNPAHIAAIERLQPYAGCQWTGTLRDISNPDKHRELVGIVGDFNVWLYAPYDVDFHKIVASETSAIHPVLGKVNMKVHLTQTILFSDKTPVMETLEKIRVYVAQTIDAFALEF